MAKVLMGRRDLRQVIFGGGDVSLMGRRIMKGMVCMYSGMVRVEYRSG